MRVPAIAVILSASAVLLLSSQDTRQLPSTNSNSSAATPAQPEKSSSHNPYVGDQACASCHLDVVESFEKTGHFRTSSLPDRDSIQGSFAPGDNTLLTSNPELSFRMDAANGGFFETALQGMSPYITEKRERIDFVVGSGGKGQTYLYWKENQIFQLPVSYWTQLGWVNSPGYRDGTANFDRAVIPRCLECHATYFEADPPPPNRYRKDGFVVGITCEKCHGPGREHIQRENSKSPGSSAVLNPSKFPRDRQMDLCGWCHAGAGVPLVASFSFAPGEPLNRYLKIPPPDPDAAIDVHGSQIELLERSRCFRESDMTCVTCHDVHRVQHDLAAFSERCLKCHKPSTAMFPKSHHEVSDNCIDCHMPEQETNLIVFESKGKKVRPSVRSHWIRVYDKKATE